MKFIVCFILVISVVIFCGIYNINFGIEFNKCDMTYMFDWPEFIQLELRKHDYKKFPFYKLYLYGEGPQANLLRRTPLSGIPVLFLPGNAGSYKQVRSLASVALQMANTHKANFHFNYFAVDFNEEMSALFGEFLLQQRDFTSHAIKHILSLYSGLNKPTSVILIGHSMGGIVAKSLFLLKDFNPSRIQLILTLATPLVMPVAYVDSTIHGLYDEMKKNSTSSVPFISISGGTRDVFVRDGLAMLNMQKNTFYTSTTAVPGAWASADHLCICWCKQLVIRINRALFEWIGSSTNFTNSPHSRVIPMFKKHLEHKPFRYSPKIVLPNSNSDKTFRFSKELRWIVKKDQKHFLFERNQLLDEMYLKIGPLQLTDDEQLVIVANEMPERWVFLCLDEDGIHSDSCLLGQDISELASITPPADLNRKMLFLSKLSFKGITAPPQYLVLRLTPTQKQMEIFYEVYSRTERHLSVALPSWSSFFYGFPNALIGKPFHQLEIANKALYYRLEIEELRSLYQGYWMRVVAVNCASKVGSVGLLALSTPWNRGYTHALQWYWQNVTLPLMVTSSKPAISGRQRAAFVSVLLDSTCQHRLELGVSLVDSIAQLLRVFAPFFPGFMTVHLFNALGVQYKFLAKGKDVPGLLASLKHGLRPFIFFPLAMIVDYIMKNWFSLSSDWSTLASADLWTPFLPHALWLLGVAPFGLLVAILWSLVVSLTFFFQIVKFFRCFNFVSRVWLASWFSTLLAILAIVVAHQISPALALLILFVAQLNRAAIYRVNSITKSSSQMQFSYLLLMAYLLMLKSPSLVVWIRELIHNFRAIRLVDSSLFALINLIPRLNHEIGSIGIVTLCALAWGLIALSDESDICKVQFNVPSRTISFWIGWLLHISIVVVLLTCIISWHQLVIALTGALVLCAQTRLTRIIKSIGILPFFQ